MDQLDDKLEECFARLEGGESLEACLSDLSEDEALLLKKAAALRTIASTVAVPSAKFATQRRELLQLTKEKNMKSSEAPIVSKTRPRWILPAALAGGSFAFFTCLVVFSLLAGLAGLRWFRGGNNMALKPSGPQSAVLRDLQGSVEVQDDGIWETAQNGQMVKAGQRVRTGELSNVTLGFYDGSQTQLGPNSELSVDELNAKKSKTRVVVLTQWLGETKHDVAKSKDPASRYEVHTPSGVGTAKGTSFHVVVTAAMLVRFDVDEGAVAVTNLDTTVLVVAGQSTVIVFGQIPTPPVFRMKGQGIVEQTGSVWHIAGRTFRTSSETVFVGTPQIGDEVSFEARVVTDGSPILDKVVLIVQSPDSRFSFTGTVDSIGDAQWTVAGRTVQVDENTEIDSGIQAGNIVEVKGTMEDGEFLATDIRLVEEDPEGLPFEFTGVIDAIGATEWTVSGITVTVDGNTQIESGLSVGDVAHVQGRVQDETWLAKSIERAEEDEREFTITGAVDSMDPWTVNGVEFDTDERTEIEEGIGTGVLVRVEGRILEDGNWLAEEIELVEDDEEMGRFSFTGLVNSMEPWNVGGIDFTTDEHTDIEDQVSIGDLVRVKGVVLPDGTWLAQEIKRLDQDLGCLNYSTVVRETGDNQIILLDWDVIHLDHDDIEVEGDIRVAAVILIYGCTDEDGDFTVTQIIVIYQLDSLTVIINPRHDGDEDDDHDDDDDEEDD